jgi:ATP-dependent Lhr-like helicase
MRAFFGAFGLRLRPIQQEAFATLEPGRDALIMAPTGSGKTEAALAPVAELLQGSRGRLRALVLSPRQALASDLHTRLSETFAKLGLRLDVATGDKNTCSATKPPDLLIRTPEGLDSMLVRQETALAAVQVVVIDEIHTFLDDARGTQLVGLLQRLATVSPGFYRLGVSATLQDPSAPERAGLVRQPVMVREASDRGTLAVSWFDWHQSGNDAKRFIQFLREQRVRKAIGFAGSRAKVELLAHTLNTGYLQNKIFVHHAGISQSVRRNTEQMLRNLPVAFVVATTTLEVGIDIGGVDTCVLFDAPPDRAAFLQRAGRAGRRSGQRQVVCVSGLYSRRVDFARVMPGQAETGLVDTKPFLSGCLQQIGSYVAQHDGADMSAVSRFLGNAYGVSPQVAAELVSALVAAGILTRDQTQLRLSDEGESMLETRQLHLTFAPAGGAKVVDRDSGRSLGRALATGSDQLLLGGQARKVVGFDTTTGAALTVPHSGGRPQFVPGGDSRFEWIARGMRGRLGAGFRFKK